MSYTINLLKETVNSYTMSAVKVGQLLRLNWTNCYNFHTAIVRVVKINICSIRISLESEIPEGYEKGQEWSVQTKLTTITPNNCLLFLEVKT